MRPLNAARTLQRHLLHSTSRLWRTAVFTLHDFLALPVSPAGSAPSAEPQTPLGWL